MTEHATTGDAINHAIDKASDGITQLSHVIATAAPQVGRVALAAVQADAYANVVYGVESLAVVGFAIFIWRKWYWPWTSAADAYDLDPAKFMAGAALCAVIGLFGFIAICTVFDPWTYIAMSHPDMFLAHKLMADLSK